MRLSFVFGALAAATLLVAPAQAEHYPQPTSGATGSAALHLTGILSQMDEQRGLEYMEDFANKFQNEKGATGWILELRQSTLIRTGKAQEAIAIGKRLLELDPDDLEAAYRNVQLAESQKDEAGAKNAMAKAAEISRRILANPDAPLANMARQILQNCEYQEYVQIAQVQNPRTRLAMMDAFQASHPNSTYLPNVQAMYLTVYEQMGDREKVLALAEQMINKGTATDKLAQSVAEHYFKAGNVDKALRYSARAAELAGRQPRPDNVTENEWNRRVAKIQGRAHWMAGRILMDRGQFAEADREFREALPALQGNDVMLAEALFHLGWANYKLGHLVEAEKFNQACVQYRGPFQEAARRHLDVIRAQRSSNR
jgi:tetratricopeptide (TPR) repeat protein